MPEHSDPSEAPVADEAAGDPGDEAVEGVDQAALDAYDLDDDGSISLTENVRGELGMFDARAEELADEPGLKGKVARATHRLLDKLDND